MKTMRTLPPASVALRARLRRQQLRRRYAWAMTAAAVACWTWFSVAPLAQRDVAASCGLVAMLLAVALFGSD